MTVTLPSSPVAPVTPGPSTTPRRVVAGGSLLAGAVLLANAGNYALNLFLARVLTPAEFSDAGLVVTIMFTLTSVALCLQLVAARFVAQADERGDDAGADVLATRLRRTAVAAGVLTGAALAVGAPSWSSLFRTSSPWPFVVLGAGIPFWLVQAVGRGVLQARLRFAALAASFLVEAFTRVGLAVLLVAAGCGVVGATAALTTSFVVTCAVVGAVSRSVGRRDGAPTSLREVRSYAARVSVLLVGQIVAGNSDVLVAKAVFPPTDAGVYAAVALVGRAVFFLAWTVATVVFPVVARRHAAGQGATAVLKGGIVAVVAIGTTCAVGALGIGGPVVGAVLGPAYEGLAVPLAAYALTTTLFAVANLVATYRLTRSCVGESWMLLLASVLQVALMLVRHQDMATLIADQAVAMGALVLYLAGLGLVRRAAATGPATPAGRAS